MGKGSFFVNFYTDSLSLAASIDVSRLSRGGLSECSVLQEAVAGVAYCEPRQEFGQELPEGAEKVVKVYSIQGKKGGTKDVCNIEYPLKM